MSPDESRSAAGCRWRRCVRQEYNTPRSIYSFSSLSLCRRLRILGRTFLNFNLNSCLVRCPPPSIDFPFFLLLLSRYCVELSLAGELAFLRHFLFRLLLSVQVARVDACYNYGNSRRAERIKDCASFVPDQSLEYIPARVWKSRCCSRDVTRAAQPDREKFDFFLSYNGFNVSKGALTAEGNSGKKKNSGKIIVPNMKRAVL